MSKRKNYCLINTEFDEKQILTRRMSNILALQLNWIDEIPSENLVVISRSRRNIVGMAEILGLPSYKIVEFDSVIDEIRYDL